MSYDKRVMVAKPYADAVVLVREALARQGFGVLTEVDLTATMRAKLGAEIEDFVLLGACNPPLAHRALEIDRTIALLLPCNVTVRATPDGCVVEILDPQMMVEVTGRPELKTVADEAAARLDAVIAEIAAA
jgi:uncharacterized protein (DUF302 family)